MSDPTVRIAVQEGPLPKTSDAFVSFPVSPEDISHFQESGWTIYKLARAAFERIPQDLPDERAAVGRSLETIEALGHNVTLMAYGPIDGKFYIELPKV